MSPVPDSVPTAADEADGHLIVTPRLRLVRMSAAFLAASAAGDRELAELLIGCRAADEWFAAGEFIELRRLQLHDDPGYAPWAPRAIAWVERGEMIGHLGFHAPPNAPYLRELAPDAIEFGYTIFPAFRRQGFAREAIGGLLGWAIDRGVRRFVVSIAPGNAPSLALARQFGFAKIGEQLDEVDGLEEVYLWEAPAAGGAYQA